MYRTSYTKQRLMLTDQYLGDGILSGVFLQLSNRFVNPSVSVSKALGFAVQLSACLEAWRWQNIRVTQLEKRLVNIRFWTGRCKIMTYGVTMVARFAICGADDPLL